MGLQILSHCITPCGKCLLIQLQADQSMDLVDENWKKPISLCVSLSRHYIMAVVNKHHLPTCGVFIPKVFHEKHVWPWGNINLFGYKQWFTTGIVSSHRKSASVNSMYTLQAWKSECLIYIYICLLYNIEGRGFSCRNMYVQVWWNIVCIFSLWCLFSFRQE